MQSDLTLHSPLQYCQFLLVKTRLNAISTNQIYVCSCKQFESGAIGVNPLTTTLKQEMSLKKIDRRRNLEIDYFSMVN